MTLDPGLLPLGFLLLTALALAGVPLAAAAFFSGVLMLGLNPTPLPNGFMLNYSLAMRLNSPALISIPLFALAGELAVAAGITERLLNVADILAGRGKNAVGARTIFGCTLFATVSGVGPAAVTAEGKRLIPDMLRSGYRPQAAAAAIAAAAGLAIIIPASVPLTIYAATTGIQTNIVFTASFIPGLLIAGSLFLVTMIYASFQRSKGRDSSPHSSTSSQKIHLVILNDAKWALLMPLLVLSALFTGLLTAPEAAAFASVYAVAIGFLCHKSLKTSDLKKALANAATVASAVLLLAGVGGLFTMLLDACGFSQRLSDAIYAFSGGAAGSILVINGILLAAGCFLDMPAIINLVVPPLLPLAVLCGMSLPHFGVMVVVNIAIGLLTPPQAHNISAAARQAGVSMSDAAKAAWPYLLAMTSCLLAVSYIPDLSLWLPGLFGWRW